MTARYTQLLEKSSTTPRLQAKACPFRSSVPRMTGCLKPLKCPLGLFLAHMPGSCWILHSYEGSQQRAKEKNRKFKLLQQVSLWIGLKFLFFLKSTSLGFGNQWGRCKSVSSVTMKPLRLTSWPGGQPHPVFSPTPALWDHADQNCPRSSLSCMW